MKIRFLLKIVIIFYTFLTTVKLKRMNRDISNSIWINKSAVLNLYVSFRLKEIVENIRLGMDQIETTPETTCSFAINTRESPSDDGYSNIYNVLQPNYGAKRHSYPSVVTEYEEKCYTYSYFRRTLTLGRKLPEA